MGKTGITKVQAVIIGVLLIVAASGGIWYYLQANTQTTKLKVFHAGSLTVPFESIEAEFEADHPNVDVQLEPGGSVTRIQKVTELGERGDVVACADYSLIPNMMMTSESDYTDWYVIFAVNQMTLTYSDSSRYADQINSDNWYQILRRNDVKFGFADPNMDPCGYRSLMVIQLAESEYGDDPIFEDLIEANSDITVSEEDGVYYIDTNMTDLNPNTERLMIREKSVDLVSFVQGGGLDYAFEYSSVAKQHGLQYLDLPPSIDLSSPSEENQNLYRTVKVSKTSGVSTGKPIVYGLTIPHNAPHPDLAVEFVKYIINDFGKDVFDSNGQPPMNPALTNDLSAVPEPLKNLVEQED